MSALAIESEPPEAVESLDDLAQQINAETLAAGDAYRIARAADDKGSAHAIAAGRLLIRAKETVGHGKWLSWLVQNCEVEVRTAQLYTRLANKHDAMDTAKAQRVAHLALREAVKEIAEPKHHTIHYPEPTWRARVTASPIDGDDLEPTIKARVSIAATPSEEEEPKVWTSGEIRKVWERGKDTSFERDIRAVLVYTRRADPERAARVLQRMSVSGADMEDLSSWTADVANELSRMA